MKKTLDNEMFPCAALGYTMLALQLHSNYYQKKIYS